MDFSPILLDNDQGERWVVALSGQFTLLALCRGEEMRYSDDHITIGMGTRCPNMSVL